MPTFVEAFVVVVVSMLAVTVGKGQSRPSGTARDDLAWGIDLLVAAGALQAGILSKEASFTVARLTYLIVLLCFFIVLCFTMNEFGYDAVTNELKVGATIGSAIFGILILVLCYIANTETGVSVVVSTFPSLKD